MKYEKKHFSQRNVKFIIEVLSKTAHLIALYKYTFFVLQLGKHALIAFVSEILAILLENNSWSNLTPKDDTVTICGGEYVPRQGVCKCITGGNG